jgi:methylated-DNA-protein-cysteine methyltransferase-like protein
MPREPERHLRENLSGGRFHERVLMVVATIPRGNVTTYGRIAELLGRPRSVRQVGGALSRSPDTDRYPCHRVVDRNGILSGGWAFGRPDIMRQLLLDEGVPFLPDGRVNLAECLWEPDL